jgi:hypothetical protein
MTLALRYLFEAPRMAARDKERGLELPKQAQETSRRQLGHSFRVMTGQSGWWMEGTSLLASVEIQKFIFSSAHRSTLYSEFEEMK